MGNYVNRLASRFASNFVSKHPKPSDEKPETNKSQNTVLLPKAVGDAFDELVRIKITPTEWGHARGAWIFDHSPDWLDNEEVPALGLYISQTLLKKLDVGSDENNRSLTVEAVKRLIEENSNNWQLYIDDVRHPRFNGQQDIVVYARTTSAAETAIELFGCPRYMDLDYYLSNEGSHTVIDFLYFFSSWLCDSNLPKLQENFYWNAHSSDPNCNERIAKFFEVIEDPFVLNEGKKIYDI